MIVAIDGPAGSGKSTTARRVAEGLGWVYLDTGSMYRAVALAFLEAGAAFTEESAHELLPDLALDVRVAGTRTIVSLNGADVSEKIRTPEVDEAASRVSALEPVRQHMVAEQRRVATKLAHAGVVVEGRDIGTVVFPEAQVKVFLVAGIEERAKRRHRELAARGEHVPLENVLDEIGLRDDRDRGRAIAPLRQAEDAVTIDTTGLSLTEQVQAVTRLIKERQREHVAG